MVSQNVGVTWVESGTGERRVTSEDYPLPVSATFAGSVNVGSVDGDTAHDAPDSGDPIKIGGKAATSLPLAVANGDRVNAYFDEFGRLVVTTGGGSLNTVPQGTVDEVAPAVTSEGAAGNFRITPTRDLRVCLTDSAGANVGTGSNTLFTSTGGTAYHDSPLGAPGDVRPNILGGVARTAEPTAVSADVDSVNAYFDLNGYQYVKSSGNVAHDAVDAGNPVKIGGYASAATPTAVSAGDRVNAWFDVNGNQGVFTRDLAGNTYCINISGYVDEVSPLVIAEGSVYPCRMTPTKDLRVCLTDSAGANLGTAGNPVRTQDALGLGGSADAASYVRLPYQSRSDTFTATGNGTTVDASGSPKQNFTIQATATGAVTSWTIVLEGSLDNATFTTILTHTNADPGTGGAKFSTASTPFLYFRARCSAISLGGGTNVIATILGSA